MDAFSTKLLSSLESRSSSLECHSDASGDYYGLGIRIGIYFAWLNAYLANVVVPGEFAGAAAANTIFLMTLFIAIAKDSMGGLLTQVDVLILMHLCGGATFGVLSIWGYRTRFYADKGPKAVGYFGSYGTHIRIAMSFAISVYGFWFWAWGVNGGLRQLGPSDGMQSGKNTEACTPVCTFFFAKLRADEGIRYYYILVCAGCTLYFGVMLLASSLTVWFSLERLFGLVGDRWSESAHVDTLMRPRYVTGFSVGELSAMYKFLRIANPIWLLWSILTVEFTLNFNHITGVLGGPQNSLSTPGQLLPLLVGGFGFAQTLYVILKEKVFQRNFQKKPGTHYQFGPSVLRSTTELDTAQQKRNSALRYLVGYLPWLSLLQTYDQQLVEQGISRSNTGLEGLPMSPRRPLSPKNTLTSTAVQGSG